MTYNAKIAALPMPDRIRRLPVSPAGFPVPWFVAWLDGVPDFRVIDTPKLAQAVRRKLCWVCGEPLGRTFAMTIGPMCAINRTISEPPSHRDCAVYSAVACPFLSNPRMRRNHDDMPDHHAAPGVGLQRNPGAVAVWITRSYSPFRAPGGGTLFTFGDPLEVLWFASGRSATRAEVMQSINRGLPELRDVAVQEGPGAMRALGRMTAAAMRYLPTGATDTVGSLASSSPS